MKITITDTNVFIDLIKSETLDAFFQCPLTFFTSDLVISEIKVPEQLIQLERYVSIGKLQVLELSADELRAAYFLKTECNLKRITDKSLLLKAIEMQACLLSGDRDLRKEGERAGLEVHGTLWVVQQIWEYQLLPKEKLLEIIDAFPIHARLPKKALAELRKEIAK